MEGRNNTSQDWSKYLERSHSSTANASEIDFENMGGLSVIERDEAENQRTMANDVTLIGLSPHSTWFRNSPQDTLSDLFGPETASSTRFESSGSHPSLEEAAQALRNMTLDDDLVGALAGLTKNSEKKTSSPAQLIYSSHQSVSWFNVAVYQESCQVLVLKNTSSNESITTSLKIDGNDSFFRFVNGNRLIDGYQVTLQPQAQTEVKISFRPATKGQITGRIWVCHHSRRFNIPLYGYGGKSTVFISNVEFSKEHDHLIVFVPIRTSTVSFVLKNRGDENALFTIQNASVHQCRVSPSEGTVSPGTSAEISIRCRIDYSKLTQNRSNFIVLDKLAVSIEDVVTNLRIERMKDFEGKRQVTLSKFKCVNELNDNPKTAMPPEINTVFILVCITTDELKQSSK